MVEGFGARTLWAMHSHALPGLLRQLTVNSMTPPTLASMAEAIGGGSDRPAGVSRQGVALIVPLEGPLSPQGSYGGTSTEWFADTMREAAGDRSVELVIVRIASMGGLVAGTAEAADAVYAARQVKTVIAIANPYSFSAAHWIGTQASAYYASTSGEVGSVGISGGHVDVSGFERKVGMRTTLIASDPEKIAGHPYGPLSAADRADMQERIDDAARSFTAAIARGRGIRPAAVASIHGKGQTFSATRARAAGIIDGVRTMRDVLAASGSSRTRLALMRRRAAL